MTAPIPHGLFNVTSTLRVEPPFSDHSDIIFERLQTLRNFWKVHNAQSRVSRDVGNIRSRQLFWRVWGDPRLSLKLKQSTLIQLWMRCQENIDLTPFHLELSTTGNEVEHSLQSRDTTDSYTQSDGADRTNDDQSQLCSSPVSTTPAERSLESFNGNRDNGRKNRQASASTQSTNLRPTPNRATSNSSGGGGGGGNRKRTSFQASNARGRMRPSIGRKRSSQSQQTSDTGKIRPALKSPRSSIEGSEIASEEKSSRTLLSSKLPRADLISPSPTTTISACELPSASSWQSVDSHPDHRSTRTGATNADDATSLAIDKNFREKFMENQKNLNSSTNLVGMNKLMRKTGSVVRFADEINIPEEIHQSRRLVQPVSSQLRSKSEGQAQSWKQNLQRHDSVGSVAAVSEDGSGDDEGDEDNLTMLPRVRSQLSLGIADLKRSQSMKEIDTEFAVTSPQIEVEQEALIKGKKVKAANEEEEKLLAMGRKDGVTRAGGVNLPRELIVKGAFEFSDESESSEEPLY